MTDETPDLSMSGNRNAFTGIMQVTIGGSAAGAIREHSTVMFPQDIVAREAEGSAPLAESIADGIGVRGALYAVLREAEKASPIGQVRGKIFVEFDLTPIMEE